MSLETLGKQEERSYYHHINRIFGSSTTILCPQLTFLFSSGKMQGYGRFAPSAFLGLLRQTPNIYLPL
jgi:hypothetical protein